MIDLSDHRHCLPTASQILEVSQKIERNLGVRTQTVSARTLGPARHELGNHVDAQGQQLGCHLAVVDTRMVPLRRRIIEIRAGPQIKLTDLNIGWESVSAHGAGVRWCRPAGI